MLFKIETGDDGPARQGPAITVNPTLAILPVRWKNLPAFVRSTAAEATLLNEPAHVIVWRHPKSGALQYREAEAIDLLALKLVVEQIDPLKAAQMGNVTPGDIQTAIGQSVSRGLLLSSGSRILRKPPDTVAPSLAPYLSTDKDPFCFAHHRSQVNSASDTNHFPCHSHPHRSRPAGWNNPHVHRHPERPATGGRSPGLPMVTEVIASSDGKMPVDSEKSPEFTLRMRFPLKNE